MQSPPSSPTQNLQGASRVTGGFARGCARGNVFNFADAINLSSDPSTIYQKGKILLYTSNGDVSIMKSKVSLKHDVMPTLRPILLSLKKRYTWIYGTFQLYYLVISFSWNLIDSKASVCVYEDDMWDLKGEFDVALENDEEVIWEFKNDGYILRVLVVSFI